MTKRNKPIIQIKISIILFGVELPTRNVNTIGHIYIPVVHLINFVTKTCYCAVHILTEVRKK